MSAETDIYDLEGAIEESFAVILRTNGLAVVTPVSGLEFQKARPRVELTAVLQGGAGRPLLEDTVPDRVEVGHMREQAWRMQLKAEIISGLTITEHRAYISTVRNRFAKIAAAVNGVTLLKHFVQSVRDAGASPHYKSNDGYYQTTALFDLAVSVQTDAWAALAE